MKKLNNMKVASAVLDLRSQIAHEHGHPDEAGHLERFSQIAAHLSGAPYLFKDSPVIEIAEILMEVAELGDLADEVEGR
ncbi:hypothetical protein [Gulosibacter molinativorax]|uniref:Phage protein n=1 Tax=Gulosibacter molinativorax TaxID=256821 RepID=A0ABT7C987_9MICO|nr:hypothetical protein [Gulosibacter molinativorax]MDJ1371768.1 hypothetical protein [Gulosibacter molinativorax]QUY60862.1 Hypotetical protein [Gulosibacter molinativorax]